MCNHNNSKLIVQIVKVIFCKICKNFCINKRYESSKGEIINKKKKIKIFKIFLKK